MLLLDPVNQIHQERQSQVQQSGGILQWSCRQGISRKILTEEAFVGAEGCFVKAGVTTEKLNWLNGYSKETRPGSYNRQLPLLCETSKAHLSLEAGLSLSRPRKFLGLALPV